MQKHTIKPLVLMLTILWQTPSLWAENSISSQDISTETLQTIEVEANRHSDKVGKDRMYSREVVNIYKGKNEIETYKGSTVSDLLSGMTGVYSGDSRNSGALDPNIRGVQGEGRIPVTIDGTQQALTVWRGYMGANNRNFVDPNLISSVYAEKGSSFTRGIKSGIGGSIALKTLDANDIVPDGQKYGLEVKLETANNSIQQRPNPYEKSVDYRTLPNPENTMLGMWRAYFDDSDRFSQRFGDKNKFLEDKAYRIAAATKQDHFDAMLAYAYRSKGNYFSGTKGAEKYGYVGRLTVDKINELDRMVTEAEARGEDFWGNSNGLGAPNVARVGLFFAPGGEVTNTSLETKSWLGKTTFHLPNHQTLKVGLRHSDITFGEIMPSRIIGPINITDDNVGKVAEWPESWVKQKAYNLDYTWKPTNNRWIDLEASLWTTRTRSKTNTAGGTPGDAIYLDNSFTSDYVMWREIIDNWANYSPQEQEEFASWGYSPDKRPVPSLDNTDGRFNTRQAQAYYATNNRMGFNFSNRMRLTDELDLTILGDFQNEKLKSYDEFSEMVARHHTDKPYANDGNNITINTELNQLGIPRNGKRREWNLAFNFVYRPIHWLTLSAGARYTNFGIQDLSQQAQTGLNRGHPLRINLGKQIIASRVLTNKEYQDYLYIKNLYDNHRDQYFEKYKNSSDNRVSLIDSVEIINDIPYIKLSSNTVSSDDYFSDFSYEAWYSYDKAKLLGKQFLWERDDSGKLHAQDNPLTNPNSELNSKVINPITGELVDKYRLHHLSLSDYGKYAKPEDMALARKQKGHGWVPAFSATVHFSDNARAYVRYTETLRYPSIFEGTYGFSTAGEFVSRPAIYGWKPEHAKNWEVGYIHDLTELFPKMRQADFRINYFHNKTENIIDRDHYLNSYQFDLQRRTGVELSARFDTGRLFGHLGVLRNITNQMCDKNHALETSYLDDDARKMVAKYPTCNHGGVNDQGYLASAIQPRWSVESELGARFLGEKLETGLRFHYHSRTHKNRKDVLRDHLQSVNYRYNQSDILKQATDSAGWQHVGVWDAFIRYKINKNFSAELVGTNLGDRYYLDPLSRSYMPAPGRTIRLGITGKF